jgi:hypothetical protein
MTPEIASQTLITLMMLPVSYLIVRLYLWGLGKIGNVTEWHRGFGWGLFFWAQLGENLWQLVRLL